MKLTRCAAILGLLLLAACGQKGPLVLPKPVAAPAPATHDVPPVEQKKQ